MPPTPLAAWIVASLLISLRIAPALTFAPPFTLIRLPALFRVFLGLGLAAQLAAWMPAATGALDAGRLVEAAARELLVGLVFVVALQLMFGAIYVAGRTIDIQAGFGLAALIDPSSKAQTPLVGSLFAYAAGMAFFAMDGHVDLLRLMAASLEAAPVGQGAPPATLAHLTAFTASVFSVAFGAAGGAILALFAADAAIALMSRTIPQMNVLILGLQVKTLLLLIVLPLTAGVWGALLARLVRVTLDGIPRLL